MKLARKLLILFIILFGLNVFVTRAQSPDTVCAGTTGKNYYVTATTGSTYNWTINGGVQATGTNTNSITIDFNTSDGIDTIWVQETDSSGCKADAVALAIVRMPLPTAIITGDNSLCYNDSTQLSVALTGTFPLSLTYTAGAGNIVVNNIMTSPYQFSSGVLSAGSHSYNLVSVTDRLTCAANPAPSSSATVIVFPKPVTSPIYH